MYDPRLSPALARPLVVLIAPAHWSGRTHQLQLHAVARELAARGHAVHYVTSAAEPAAALPPGVTVHVAGDAVRWPEDLDVELALRCLRPDEPPWHARVELVGAALDTAEAFFGDGAWRALRDVPFDIALVDAGSLAAHLLVDALHPLPYCHFLSYPYRPPPSGVERETHELESEEVGRRVGPRLGALRDAIGAPPKRQCARLHMLTITGSSRALHAGVALPSSMHCVGSVLPLTLPLQAGEPPRVAREGPQAEALPEELGYWADGAGEPGFVVVSLGSWADEAASRMGLDAVVIDSLAELGLPAIWKRRRRGGAGAAEPAGAEAALPANVRTAEWLPQRALLTHPRCAVLVSHGGANSLSEACACEVPVVGLPIAGWSDQPANVQMLEELGVGASAVPSEGLAACTSASLLGAIRHVLADGGRAERAAALAASMRANDTGAAGAARLLEQAAAVYDGDVLAG